MMTNQQENLYNKIIDESFNCNSIEDVNKLLVLFKTNKWDSTNYRMLKWVLDQKVEQFQNKPIVKKESLFIDSLLKIKSSDFLIQHMN